MTAAREAGDQSSVERRIVNQISPDIPDMAAASRRIGPGEGRVPTHGNPVAPQVCVIATGRV